LGESTRAMRRRQTAKRHWLEPTAKSELVELPSWARPVEGPGADPRGAAKRIAQGGPAPVRGDDFFKPGAGGHQVEGRSDPCPGQ